MFEFLRRKKKDEPKPEPKEEKPTVEEEPVPDEEQCAEEECESDDKKEKAAGAYFVSPHPDGGWQVKRAKAQKALKRFKTKAEAEEYAKQVAENQGSNVVRQKKDGKIQKTH